MNDPTFKLWTRPRLKRRTKMIAVALGVAFVVDISGTPLSLLALHKTNQNQTAAIAATVQARKDDCESANRDRAQQRVSTESSARSLPIVLRSITSIPRATIERIIQVSESGYAASLQALGSVNCYVYAHRAAPR